MRRHGPARRAMTGASSSGAASSSFLSVISGSPDRPSHRACLCRCRPRAAPCGPPADRGCSTFGTSPSRRKLRIVPSASRSVTRKSSMRSSSPSTFSPDGSVTIASDRPADSTPARRGRRARRRRRPRCSAALADRELASRCPADRRSPNGSLRTSPRSRPGRPPRRRPRGSGGGASPPAARPALGLRLHAVDVLGDRLHVVVRHRQRRHALVGAAAADDRQDQFALLIVEHELRSKQVRSAQLAAAQVDAVAGAAGDRIERLPALDERRIARRTLLRREDGGTPAASLAAPAAGGG